MDKISDRNKDNVNTSFNTYYKDKKFQLIDFPSTIVIDTVSLCNLRCSMCMTKDSTRKKGFMDWNLYTKIIDEIAQENKNTRIFMSFSGEPLVRIKYKPDIFAMIKYAKDKGLNQLVMNTNACLMNEEVSCKILKSGLKQVFIGIDAFSPEVYSQNRCRGNYEQTVNNVLKLLELKNEMKLETPIIECQFIEMDNNIHEKSDFIDFWISKGANVKIRPMCTWAGKINRQIMTETLTDRQPCSWAMTTMIIAHNGQVVNCACDLGAEIDNGNINNESIKAIWNTKLKDFRLKHIEHRFEELNDMCRNCRDWQSSGEIHYNNKNWSNNDTI